MTTEQWRKKGLYEQTKRRINSHVGQRIRGDVTEREFADLSARNETGFMVRDGYELWKKIGKCCRYGVLSRTVCNSANTGDSIG